MIKLVMLDLDGTLLDPNRRISKANKKAIKEVHHMGIPVVICTGRNKRLTKHVTKKLPVKVHYCCVGGVEIYDPNDRHIFSQNLDIDEISGIVDMVKTEPCLVQVTTHKGYHKYVLDPSAKKYDAFSADVFSGKIMNLMINMAPVKSLESFKNRKFNGSQELVIAGDMVILEKLKARIESNYEHLQARIDMWPNYLFVTKKGLGKGNSAKVLADHFNISVDEILAIGDDYNDVDMIETVGYGIAMADAIDVLKSIAYDQTYSNRDSGVAHALRHYIIDKKTSKIMEGC